MRSSFLVPVVLFSVAATATAMEPVLGVCRPLPELDETFQRTRGWVGADGAYSVALSDEVTLWLFGDTFIGTVSRGDRRVEAMPRNTIGLQRGRVPSSRNMALLTGSGKDGTFFEAPGGRGWCWPLHGWRGTTGLYLFFSEIESTGENSAFGFRQTGNWLVRVANWWASPERWKQEWLRLPFSSFPAGAQPEPTTGGAEIAGPSLRLVRRGKRPSGLTFGTATLAEGDWLYIYGVRETRKAATLEKVLVLARAPARSPERLGAWRFRTPAGWSADPAECAPLAAHAASELSVSAWSPGRTYVLVSSKDGLAPDVVAATAPFPWGPWGPWRTIHTCPETQLDRAVFCYAAKGHPELSKPGTLLITYATNAMELGRVAGDPALYRPRFLLLERGSEPGRPGAAEGTSLRTVAGTAGSGPMSDHGRAP